MNTVTKDAAGLEPIGNHKFLIGSVDEVNGRGAEEISAFVPTRYEMIQLAKYWANVAIDIEYFWFCCEQVGSSDRRRRSFAWRRVSRIAELLGENEIDQAVKDAYDDFGKSRDPRIWNIFRNGTREEREQLQREFAEELMSPQEGDTSAEAYSKTDFNVTKQKLLDRVKNAPSLEDASYEANTVLAMDMGTEVPFLEEEERQQLEKLIEQHREHESN
jgi:hypothetical protein